MQTTLPSKERDVNRETAWKQKMLRAELSARVLSTLLAHQQAVAQYANIGTVTQTSFLRDRGFSLLACWLRVLERLRIIQNQNDMEEL